MTGDISDIVRRLKSNLPNRWFPDQTPVLDAVLSGLASAWVAMYSLLGYTQSQTRIASVNGNLLDAASADFFGSRLSRISNEPDNTFRLRLQNALVREHATRRSLQAALMTLTGSSPKIFEPGRVTDTGAYGSPVMGYGVAGAWGNLNLPFQVFIVAKRPASPGIAIVAGYGTPGPLARANLSQVPGYLSDKDIENTVVSVLPTASIAWLNITD